MRRIPIPHSVLLPALLVAALLTTAAPAHAVGSPYRGLTITYRDESTYTWQVREAVAVWNRSGIPFRIVPARPRTRADITFTRKPWIGSPNSSIAGFGGIGFVQLSAARLKSPKTFHNGQVRIVAHELGHALGLGHVRNACAIMYSAQDYPTAPRCATPLVDWDAKQHCGPRTPDVTALGRMYGFRPRAVPDRGTCITPTDPAKAATGPYVGGSLSATATQFPSDGAGAVEVTLTNTGNTVHEIGSYGLVLVDAAGAVLPNAWRFGGDYWAVAQPPAPGQSTTLTVPPCNGEYPVVMRLRLGSKHHDTFLGPEVHVRIDTSDGDPAAPATECQPAPQLDAGQDDDHGTGKG